MTSASDEKWRPFNCFLSRVGLRTYQHSCNIKAFSLNHCGSVKAIRITYSECVFLCISVALVIRHAVRMRRVILSCVACPALPYFPTLSHKRHDFMKNVTEREMCVLIFSTNSSQTFFILSRIERDVIIKVRVFACEVPVTSVQC